MPDLLTADELAERFKVSASLFRLPRWRARHGLVAVRVGRLLRFREEDVRRYVLRSLEASDLKSASEER